MLDACQIPDELPSTGPVEVVIAIVIIAGIGGAGYYFYRTNRSLKHVERGIFGGKDKNSGKNSDKNSGNQNDQ